MPRTQSKASTNSTLVKTEEPLKVASMEAEDQVDFDEDVEEEVEYEEVEEEVEEEDEEEEEEVEEEVEDEEDEEAEDDEQKGEHGEEMENAEKEHDELLALPPYGSEVYLGGIPTDALEEDLKEFCESIGEVTEVRMMRGKDSSEHKGYAFVTFRTKDLASTAINKLNNNRELKGRKIRCSTSQAKNKLFMGNVPRNWTLDDMEKAVKRAGPGINCVELLKDPQNSRRNRGFAFIEYYNHACAEYSRQKMSNPKFKLDDKTPTVSWADPKNQESSPSSQVKAVYVKNLPKDVTQEQVEKIFEHHGKIMKVILPPAKAGHERSRFGFVHFEDRSSAMKAIKDSENYELNGQTLECSLAKPQGDQKSSGGSSNSNKASLLQNHPPRAGYGLVGGAYGVLRAGYGAPAHPQPLIYGTPSSAGMAMMPMLLPDGRIGYVLQQPSVQPHTPSPPQQQRGGGVRSGGGSRNTSGGHRRGGNDSRGRGRSRYHPY